MKILFQYLKPYKWLVFLVLLLAAMNIGFSLVDPIIFGKLIDLATYHQNEAAFQNWDDYLFIHADLPRKAMPQRRREPLKFMAWCGCCWRPSPWL